MHLHGSGDIIVLHRFHQATCEFYLTFSQYPISPCFMVDYNRMLNSPQLATWLITTSCSTAYITLHRGCLQPVAHHLISPCNVVDYNQLLNILSYIPCTLVVYNKSHQVAPWLIITQLLNTISHLVTCLLQLVPQ